MIVSFIPSPVGLDFHTWANYVAESLAVYGIASPSNDDWVSWAMTIFNVPQFSSSPQPVGYSDWQDWAQQFYGTVR